MQLEDFIKSGNSFRYAIYSITLFYNFSFNW